MFFSEPILIRLLVVKEVDNRYLEPIFICSKSENIGVKILNNTNSNTYICLNAFKHVY